MKQNVSLAFTGDIGFDRYMAGKWTDESLISDEILAFLGTADHVIANVEGPVIGMEANTTTSGAQQLLHSIDPAAVSVLKRIGADVWNINNNHIMDAGPEGLRSTLDYARSSGAKTLGAGMDIDEAMRPVILDGAGGIGLIGVGYRRACRAADVGKPGCFSWSEMDAIRDVIKAVKSTCRWCVIVAHGGEEFTAIPSPYVRDRYLAYLDMGADAVVSHHPHVPMNYETVGGKYIFYSLGNFIFDTDYQRAQFNTDVGLIVRLDFTEETLSFEPMGIRIVRGEERVVKDALPLIFRDVPPQEYELLAPLGAKLLVQATKRQMTFLYPERFANATEEQWREHFAEPLRTGRVPGECLDFYIICPLAEKEKEKAWQKSTLEDVKTFILRQLD